MFNLNIKTRILFGQGAFEKTGKASKGLGQNAAIITNSRTLMKNGTVERLQLILKEVNIESTVFNSITSNPKADEINKIAYGLRNQNVDFVIGIGGGSSIDAAKGVAALVGNKLEFIEEFMEQGKTIPSNALSIVAITTTAGTGSELSKAAIITDTKKQIKMGIRGEAIIPTIAIVDPNLTLTVPYNVTKETGFDVFAHAFESYLSKRSNMFTEMVSREAMRIVITDLPELLKDLNNIYLRSRIMFASMMVGINLIYAGTCLPHRLQYPFGAKTDTSHGLGLTMIYPKWLSKINDVSKEKIEGLMSIIPNCRTWQDVVREIEIFIKNLDFKISFSDFKVDKKNIKDFTNKVKGDLKNDPTYYDGIVEDIYNELMQEGRQ